MPAGVDGPGVDLLGAEAEGVITAARPLVEWLEAREPGVVIRSVSVNDRRVLVSVESEPRPRALRFDPPSSDELRDAAREAERMIGEACVSALARRRA